MYTSKNTVVTNEFQNLVLPPSVKALVITVIVMISAVATSIIIHHATFLFPFIEAHLMRHDLGVDLALDRAKVWSKYAKDVILYVEKRINIEMDWAKTLTKLAQERRPILKEESHLPFQSVYCFALDIVSIDSFPAVKSFPRKFSNFTT